MDKEINCRAAEVEKDMQLRIEYLSIENAGLKNQVIK